MKTLYISIKGYMLVRLTKKMSNFESEHIGTWIRRAYTFMVIIQSLFSIFLHVHKNICSGCPYRVHKF